jgi:signal transduction histidine kinase
MRLEVRGGARSLDRTTREDQHGRAGGALFILLQNLVENAINVSPPNGIVLLIVDASSIHVIDEGPGIPEEYVPFLFNRFRRAPDAGYDGAGLGLAICKEIAAAHGWSLTPGRAKPIVWRHLKYRWRHATWTRDAIDAALAELPCGYASEFQTNFS